MGAEEGIQKMIRGLQEKSLQADLIAAFQNIQKDCGKEGEMLLTKACGNRTKAVALN